MKKLLTSSAMAFILFVATSCEKENPAPPAAAPMAMEATTSFTPKGETKPKVVKGDLDGERGIAYYVVPKLTVCNCNGKWTYDIAAPNHVSYSKEQNKNTGTVGFMTMSGGIYKITITYTCPDGSSVSTMVTITVK
jgi:hypothetical protein